MAFQIIFVMEADAKSRSDYIYIRSILDEYYNFRSRNDVKISEVFMGGKGNYKKKKVINSIKADIKKYSAIGETHVIYCFDTDDYDKDPDDRKLLSDEEKYCRDNDYEFVWFCHDIEEVFLGKSVAKSEKTDIARRYSANNLVRNVNKNSLASKKMSKGKSNLRMVLDNYLLI